MQTFVEHILLNMIWLLSFDEWFSLAHHYDWWRIAKLLDKFKCESKVKQRKNKESRHAPWLAARGMLKFRDGTKKNNKHLITHTDLHKTKQQVG